MTPVFALEGYEVLPSEVSVALTSIQKMYSIKYARWPASWLQELILNVPGLREVRENFVSDGELKWRYAAIFGDTRSGKEAIIAFPFGTPDHSSFALSRDITVFYKEFARQDVLELLRWTEWALNH